MDQMMSSFYGEEINEERMRMRRRGFSWFWDSQVLDVQVASKGKRSIGNEHNPFDSD